MPTYDYICSNSNCRCIHEEIRRVDEIDNKSVCPKCGCESFYSFNPIDINVHVVGGPTHKWDSSCPFLPKRVDSDGRPMPFNTYGALDQYKKDHDLVDAFDIDADSSVKHYDDDTPAMVEQTKRFSEQDRKLKEYDNLPSSKKIFGDPTIVEVNEDNSIVSTSSSTSPLVAA
jgi:hypothetical protein